MADLLFVFVRRGDTPEVYGGEKSAIATAVGLRDLGHRIHFVTTADDGFARELAAAGLPHTVVPVGDPFHGFRADGLAGRARRLADIGRIIFAVAARVGKGTIVHTAAITGFATGWLGSALRAPVVYHVRGASMNQKVRLREEVAMLLADRTITVSRSLREQMLGGSFAFAGDRVRAIPNGFDFSEMEPPVRRSSGTRALLVAAIYGGKGQLPTIEHVLPAVRERVPGFELVLAGGTMDPAYERACREAAEGLPVTFLGYLDKGALHAQYRSADMLLLPSQREGLPRCIIEGHAFGLPVVATRVVGTVEAMRDGETGFLVERAEDMVEPIVRLASDPELRARLGAAGAAHVRRHFGLDQNVRAIDDLYRELAPKL